MRYGKGRGVDQGVGSSPELKPVPMLLVLPERKGEGEYREMRGRQ